MITQAHLFFLAPNVQDILFSYHRRNGEPAEQPGGRAEQHHRREYQQDMTASSLTEADIS